MPDKVILPNRSTNILQTCKSDLSDDSSQFTRCGGNTMGSGTITSRECLAGYYKRGNIWSKVLEEVRDTVEEDEGFCRFGCFGEFAITETYR